MEARAPDFALPDHEGRIHRLSEILDGARAVVIYFYPKDDTPGCTAEACAFRDAHEDFVKAGAKVVGISSDPADTHARFRERHGLPFLLLTDTNGRVRDAFGVRPTLGLLPGRETFVLDGHGVIRGRFRSQLRARAHASKALKLVRELVDGEAPAPAASG